MCAAEEGAKIPQMSGLRGASGEEVKGRSQSVRKIHVRSMPVCYKRWSVTGERGNGEEEWVQGEQEEKKMGKRRLLF